MFHVQGYKWLITTATNTTQLEIVISPDTNTVKYRPFLAPCPAALWPIPLTMTTVTAVLTSSKYDCWVIDMFPCFNNTNFHGTNLHFLILCPARFAPWSFYIKANKHFLLAASLHKRCIAVSYHLFTSRICIAKNYEKTLVFYVDAMCSKTEKACSIYPNVFVEQTKHKTAK